MNPDSVLFFLGENFRFSLLGDNDGEENDEDSVINDLEYYLGNYEADWDGTGRASVLEHYRWQHLKQVVWARRNSAKVREMWIEDTGERAISRMICLPKETSEETAVWIIKAVMKPN
ncbi:MAG: hypothetical protein ACKN9T_12930 [Candidatus Methylumidiphilus sp.]